MKWPIVFALLTGLFWGTYGTAVGNSRAAEKNAFKPYVMIGVAYLVWGIIGGLVGMQATNAGFSFSQQGALWGFIGGSLGAFGALTLTLAMFSGGTAMPQIVMPCVFGTAVVVNALVNLLIVKSEHAVSPMLWVGVIGTAVSIVIVAYNTPHAAPPRRPAPPPQATVSPEAPAPTAG
jgi:hypothetical protein